MSRKEKAGLAEYGRQQNIFNGKIFIDVCADIDYHLQLNLYMAYTLPHLIIYRHPYSFIMVVNDKKFVSLALDRKF